MRQRTRRWRNRLVAGVLLVGLAAAQLGGCNPTLQNTVQNGVINLSTALLGSFLQAAIQLAQEQASQGG